MTQEESGMLMRCILNELSSGKEPTTEDDPVFKLPGELPRLLYGCILARLNYAGVQITPGALMTVLAFDAKSPGDLVLWAYTIKCLAEKEAKTLISVDDLIAAFPFGIPTEEARERIWTAQKQDGAPGANWLDTKEAWGLPMGKVEQQPDDNRDDPISGG